MSGRVSQAVRISTGLLNTVLDDFPGGGSSSPGLAVGQLGDKITLSTADALAHSDVTNTATLYEGTYQYVQAKSALTIAAIRGMLVFWSDRANYIVDTVDAPRAELAGIVISGTGAAGTSGAPTASKYFWIQTIEGGRATVLGLAASTFAAGEICYSPGDASCRLERAAANTDVSLISSGATRLDTIAAAIVGIADGVKDGNNRVIVRLIVKTAN